MTKLVLAIYSVSSVQRLLDFIKTVYAYGIGVPVVIKPVGAAAQVGVPEAHKIAYKNSKPLLVLPDIKDLAEVIGLNEVFLVSEKGLLLEVRNLHLEHAIAVVFHGGDEDFTRSEAQYGKPVWFREIPPKLPPVAQAAVLLQHLSLTSGSVFH
ncbi:MAG: RecB-family nuclease [Sulfolobales archaeon]|nr:RecB-family nuclease [Sulfolobales archaeon]MCX8198939.1 RecB-family nuclease [Sulfolobales archaeon]MDW8169917.1 RecB-family nuclease [Desulfurococcaceae archaeon]